MAAGKGGAQELRVGSRASTVSPSEKKVARKTNILFAVLLPPSESRRKSSVHGHPSFSPRRKEDFFGQGGRREDTKKGGSAVELIQEGKSGSCFEINFPGSGQFYKRGTAKRY